MNKTVYIINCPPSWIKTPPLSLVYLKNYLKNKGVNIKIIDLNILFFKLFNYNKIEWLKLNKNFEQNLFNLVEEKYPFIFENLYKRIEKIEFIGFSLFKRNFSFSLNLANRVKEKFPEKNIIFGGPEILFLKLENKINCLQKYLWVLGEGEIPLFKIINEKPDNYEFEEIENLDSLPFFDFEDLNLKLYSQSLPIISSRGCPYQCNFCSERKLYKKFRYHSPEYVVEQIKYLKNKYLLNNFIFCDSLINFKINWLEQLCKLLIKNKLNIKWEAQMRIEKELPLELAKLIKKSGCYNLFVGLESASNRVLKMMNKGFDTDIALNFFKILKKAKLQFEISLIFGYPFEEEKDFNETLNFIIKNKKLIPKIAQANPFIDYLKNFKNENSFTTKGKERVGFFLKVLQRENIRYTKSFINNLIYEN
ncbi:MAG: radical SAM protein [Candidatus Aenigmatarchaeota archaeon]